MFVDSEDGESAGRRINDTDAQRSAVTEQRRSGGVARRSGEGRWRRDGAKANRAARRRSLSTWSVGTAGIVI